MDTDLQGDYLDQLHDTIDKLRAELEAAKAALAQRCDSCPVHPTIAQGGDLDKANATIVELREGIEPFTWAFISAGCTTGDCPHDNVQDCATALGERLQEIQDSARALLKGSYDNGG